MTAGRCSRAIRAAVFAAVCVLLAALGHALMSGDGVPVWALAAGLAVTGLAGWCLAGRERGLPLIVTVVVTAQAVLHSAFSLAQSVGAGAAGPASGGMATTVLGVLGHGPRLTGVAPKDPGSAHAHAVDSVGMSHMTHMSHTGHMNTAADGSSYGMLAAHLLASLLCGLWLAYGEKAAFRVLRAVPGWLAAPLRLLFALPAVPEHPFPRVPLGRSDRVPRLLLVHAITSRGPPVGTAVL
ncbi:hypothetical protein ACWEJP_27385 [Streptomyces sp. NPDC004749]|uniref:hypothetical protein n=1 Tax=Streptomyces hebeiensis TaxID=229486 RepID=UPI0031D8F6FE